MNNKGQLNLNFYLLAFVVVIVGATLFITVAQNVGTITNTRTIANESITLPANGSTIAITGQAVVGSVTLLNATTNTTIGSGNYTTADNQVLDGQLTATLTIIDPAYAGNAARISYTAEPDGYLDSTSRAVAPLIVLLMALGVALVALIPAAREKIAEFLKR